MMVHLSLFIATKRNVLKGNAKKNTKKKLNPFKASILLSSLKRLNNEVMEWLSSKAETPPMSDFFNLSTWRS